ncbi:MAG: sortase [Thermoleophilaceae bacterium]|nr:sortase [Thermoleophilaceae bacterium]
MIGGGVLTLAWALIVWQWQDPFTAAYTHWEQRGLSHNLDQEFAAFQPFHVKTGDLAAERRQIATDAARFRKNAKPGQAIGRITISRIGLRMVLVNGTDEETLKKGPGRDARTFMPGQNRLVYVAGHRTTYLAPFSHIDAIRVGDEIRIEMPYATFVYRMTGHRVVTASDLSVLRSPRHEELELQACHPRFFATHRYIAYAKLASVTPRGGRPFDVSAVAAAGP